MKTIDKAIVFSFLVIALASCNMLAPKPTETPTPTETSLPTSTNTPLPTLTPTQIPVPPTETPFAPDLPTPSGLPLSEWEGIPMMLNAIAGDGDSGVYRFTINASSDEITNFYGNELGKLGWNLLARGQSTTNSILLIFVKDPSVLTVSIIPQSDGSMYVMLVK